MILDLYLGGLAQLARAPALHAGGQRFESVILHIASQYQEASIKYQDTDFRTWYLILNTWYYLAERSLTYWKKVIEREDNSRESTECFSFMFRDFGLDTWY